MNESKIDIKEEFDTTFLLAKTSNIKEKFIEKLLFVCASFAVIIVFFMIWFLFQNAGNFFQKISLKEFFLEDNWTPWLEESEPDEAGFGAFNIIMGTILVTIGAMLIAIPLGIGSAIFIAEIAPERLRKVLKSVIELLAGVPSVVFGFFGLIVLNVFIKDDLGAPQGATWLSGSIILAIMSLPIIITVAEDAIKAVPKNLREASLSLGATKWQTIRNAVLPSAISGIAAGVILGLGRALGETMAVLMVTGNCNLFPEPITDIYTCVKTITATIGIEMGEVSEGTLHYKALFALAIVLFIISFVINALSNVIISRYKKKIEGKKLGKESKLKVKIPPILKENKDIITLFIIIYIFGLFISFVTNLLNAVILCLIPIGFIITIRIFFVDKFDEFKFIVFYYLLSVLLFWLLSSWLRFESGLLVTMAIIGFLLVIKIMKSKNQQRVVFILLSLAMLIVIYSLGAIIYYIAEQGLPAITWEFLTEYPDDAGRKGGIFPAIIGTIYLTIGALIYALPIGIAAGIYLSEYAKEGRITKIIRSGIDNLNATPSIVFGLFGFAVFVLYMDFGVSMLAGQLTLALMIIPTIIRTTEEAVKSIPQLFREGSLALGSTKWQSISKAVVPVAVPGIMTGIILGTGRASGETAPIMFTAVVFNQRRLPRFVIQPVMALTYHLFILATSIPDSETQAAGTALVLLFLVLSLYSVAILIRNRAQKKRKW